VVRSTGKTVAKGLLIGALALLIPAVAGCEAGNNAPTLDFHQAAGGAYAEVNGISISNVFVLGSPAAAPLPAGSSASVFLSLFNNGTGDDQLVSVQAPGYASSVQVTGGTVSLPSESQVNLTGPEPKVVLNDLTKPLSGGQSIPIILDFAHAGTVSLQVPVEPQSFYDSTYSTPPVTPSATATPTSTATPTPTPTTSGTATP
jgi:copper(I)-binding protein